MIIRQISIPWLQSGWQKLCISLPGHSRDYSQIDTSLAARFLHHPYWCIELEYEASVGNPAMGA